MRTLVNCFWRSKRITSTVLSFVVVVVVVAAAAAAAAVVIVFVDDDDAAAIPVVVAPFTFFANAAAFVTDALEFDDWEVVESACCDSSISFKRGAKNKTQG